MTKRNHLRDEQFLRTLSGYIFAVSRSGAVVFLLFLVYNLFFSSGSLRLPLAVLNLLSAAALFGFSFLKKFLVRQGRVFLVGTVLFAVALLNTLVFMVSSGSEDRVSFLVVIMFGSIFILLDSFRFYPGLILTLLLWYAVYRHSANPKPWNPVYVELTVAAILSVVLHEMHLRMFARIRTVDLEKSEAHNTALQALEDSRISKARLQNLLDATDEGIVFHDGKVVLDCNTRFLDILGYSHLSEIQNRQVNNFVDEEFRTVTSRNIGNRSEEAYTAVLLKKDGSPCPVRIHPKEIEQDGSRQVRMILVRDLSMDTRTRDLIQERKESIQFITDHADAVVTRWSSDDGITYVSPSCRDVLGIEPSDFLKGGTDSLRMIGLSEEDLMDSPDKSDQSSESWFHHFTDNERSFWIESVIGRVWSPKDGRFEAIVLTKDITNSKTNENRISQLVSILESTHEAIISVSSSGDLFAWNSAAAHLFDIRKEHQNTSLYELPAFSEFPGLDSTASADGDSDQNIVFRSRSSDGVIHYYSVQFLRMYDQPRRQHRVALFFRDVTSERLRSHFLSIESNTVNFIHEDGPDDVLIQLIQMICEDLDWKIGELWYPESGQERLYLKNFWHGLKQEYIDFEKKSESTVFGKGVGLPGIAWTRERAIWFEDVTENSSFVRQDLARKAGLKSAVGIPIVYSGGTKCVLTLFNEERISPSESLLNDLSLLGVQIGQVIRQVEMEVSERKTRALFQTMAESSPIGLFVTDASGLCRYVNPTYEDITGQTSAMATGEGWVNGIHPDDRDKVIEGWLASVQSKDPYSGVHRLFHSSEELRWVSVSAAPVETGNEIDGYVGTVQDITEQRRKDEELQQYSLNLSAMVEERTREIEDLQEEIIAQAKDKEDLRLAAEIQENLLPKDTPSVDGFDIACRMLTARYVSGDFYYLDVPDPSHLHVVIADISGKGISAAILSASTRTLLNSRVVELNSPQDALKKINRFQYADFDKAHRFVTMAVARFDERDGLFSYASAGHTETLIFRCKDSTVETLPSTSMPVGIFPEIDGADLHYQLRPGDITLFYSDGVTEAENPQEEFFGIDRLTILLKAHGKGKSDANTIAEDIVRTVDRFSAMQYPKDDVTVIVIRASSRKVSLEKTAELDNLDEMVLWIRSHAVPYGEELASSIELVSSELLTNIIRHSYVGPDSNSDETPRFIRIELSLNLDDIVIDLYDSGKAFDFSDVPDPDLETASEGGYGLWIVKELSDSVQYSRENNDTVNHWSILKYSPRGGGEHE